MRLHTSDVLLKPTELQECTTARQGGEVLKTGQKAGRMPALPSEFKSRLLNIAGDRRLEEGNRVQ